jgi:hypothetical protein
MRGNRAGKPKTNNEQSNERTRETNTGIEKRVELNEAIYD